jgi:filamentous hemagglutinin
MNGRPVNRKVRLHVAAVITAPRAAASRAMSGGPLPVPCLPGSCGPTSPSFVTYGKASATESGNTLKVTQSTNLATLNWSSFNIGAGNTVQFQQPASSSVALNRIFQQSPSSIFGQLTANGQIYLVNPNGFLFGPTSQVNAAGIIASSLSISDQTFQNGLLTPIQNSQAALQSDGRTYELDSQGNPILGSDGQPIPVQVTVQQGAQISTPGGRILLAGQNVTNAGTLSAPDGQVILAAGQSVYLQASTDPSLRGLVVEVDKGGRAWNQLSGQVSADRGNVTLVGLAVNQDGRISATTSVSANGSVRLEAADTAGFNANSVGDQTSSPTNLATLGATHGGTLELGPASSIDIEPEYSSSATAPADPSQPQPRSEVTLVGEQVFLEGGSISAHNGVLEAVAAANPSAAGVGVVTDGNSAAQIRVHSGTSIDLSGSVAELPMSANILPLQLRSNELADDPTQRGGPLQGQTVYIDTRVGTSIVGPTALQQAEQAVPYNVAYRTTAGGSATFASEGDVVIEQGATINVSGGKTTYDGGVVQTTQLIGANGQLYDIGSANPLQAYTGVVNPTFSQTFNKWGVQTIEPTPGLSHYESGYVQGASAGSVTIAAPVMVLDGTLEGQAVNGPLQRSGSSVASGGTLTLGLQAGLPTNGSTQYLDYLTPSIEFTNQAPQFAALDGAPLLPQTLQLPVAYLGSGGFQKTVIFGNSSVTIPAGVPLDLIPGSTLQIEAPRIDLLSSITDLGGSIDLQTNLSYLYNSNPLPLPFRPGVEIGDDVTLDVRGQWTNDSPVLGSLSSYAPTLQNGGQITLSLGDVQGGELVLGNDVALRASGGAWLSSSDTLKGGTGGSIAILASPLDSALQLGSGIELDAYGVNGAAGGSFALSAPRIEIIPGAGFTSWSVAQRIDDLNAPGGVLIVTPSLFAGYGFSSTALTATGAVVAGAPSGDVLTVESGTAIAASAQTLELNSGYMLQPGGGAVAAFSQPETLLASQQTPSTVSLAVLPQAVGTIPSRLDVEAGASITTGPAGSISLVGIGGVYVDGAVRAPGGTVTLQVPSPGVVDPVFANSDPGYSLAVTLELGPQALLDVSGALVSTPNSMGLPLGNVLNGGTINLFGDRGAVVTDPGSVIDIAGTRAVLDEPTALGSGTYQTYQVGSAAGTLAVRSGVGVSLLGGIEAAGGGGNYGDPAGGTLQVDLTQGISWFSFNTLTAITPFPTPAFTIQLVESNRSLAASPQASGLAVLGISDLEAAGFDNLQLLSQDNIEFSSSTPLNLARGAVFDTPVLEVGNGVQGTVNAAYVQLANSLQSAAPASALLAGTGTLSFNAAEIDLLGNPGVSDARQVTLTSSGDLLLRGTVIGANATTPQGTFTLDGNLAIDAARIYPATATAFTVQALGGGGTVTIGQTGPSPGTPLSAGGSVAILADNIVSSGTLLAPFGTIDLAATTSLDLEPGSLTSVSAAGMTIPYGQTQLGAAQWVNTANGAAVISAIPQRAVQLDAPSLTIAKGATVDLQGGGDLQAYEWIPGTGGTVNSLAVGTVPGLYAIVPALRGQSAPYDPGEMAGSLLQPAETIYLSGGDGLAAGFYPLLPARYALLPGAYLVQVQSGFSNIAPGQQEALPNGTPVVAGYLSFGTTGLHTGGYQGIAIWPGSYGQQLAQYQVSYASSFFSAAAAAQGLPSPNLPADAGQLSIAVDQSLNVAGTVLGNLPDSSGKSSVIDVSATNIEITASPTDPVPAGTVGLAASVIDSWQPGELVLGGHPGAETTATLANGTQTGQVNIGVEANSVTIGRGAQVAAGQVIVVANQSIDLQPGSALLSTSGTSGGKAPSTAPTAIAVFLTSGASGSGPADDGAALLAVSDLELPVVQRTGTASTAGTIDVEAGAMVGSRGAIAIDAPGNVTLAGAVSGPGASWSLASGSIGFVGAGSSGDSLQIGSALQASLQQAGSLELGSLGAINLYVPVALGSESSGGTPTLSSLTLAAQSLNNLASGGTSSFTAQTISVGGPLQSLSVSNGGGGSVSATAAQPGVLEFNAGQFDVATGTLAITGVSQTRIDATSQFAAQGAAGGANGLSTSGDLFISAPLLTSANGAAAQLAAPTGTLSIQGSGGGAPPPGYLGGELDFSAATISQTGAVVVPGGIVTLKASGDIDLGGSAIIDTAGPEVAIADQTVSVHGGSIALLAGGNLSLAAGTRLDVSGAGSAAAGAITLAAAGTADVGGALAGHSGTSSQGGQFFVDAGSLSQSLTVLVDALGAGGFDNAVSIRSHTGNLDLASGHELSANSVSLTADAGAIDIGGTLSAPASSLRGEIQLFGGTGVTIEPTAVLMADASGGTGVGGNIELGAGASGSVNVDAGSTIGASGPVADGALLVRAPLVGASIAANLGGTGTANLSQLSQIIVEPVITEAADQVTPGVVTAADWSRIQSDVTSAMNAALAPITATIGAEITAAEQPQLVVRPAVDVVGTGPLTLSAAPAFSSWRYNNQPVDLTVRAGGALTVASTLSDGFQNVIIRGRNNRTTTVTVLTAGTAGSTYDSADIRLVAGADVASPNPLATVSVGNPVAAGAIPAAVTINPGTTVRTGTGEIDLIAAGDVVFGAAGAGTPGAEVYTGGVPGAPYQTMFLSSSVFNFPTSGGNVEVNAGGSIIGAPILPSTNPLNPVSGPSPTSWIISEGGPGTHLTQWGVDLTAYQSFGWNVASLGGGDVSVRSLGNMDNLSVAASDSYFTPAGGTATQQASGGLVVTAAGNIGSGEFYAADGASVLTAGGAFTTAVRPNDSGAGSLIALGNAQVSVDARLGVQIDAVVNPTSLTQAATAPGLSSGFYTYSGASSLNVQSTAGEVTLESTHAPTLLGSVSNGFGGQSQVYPATVIATAVSGDLTLSNATLFPSMDGQLRLVAGQDIDYTGATSFLTVSDAFAADVPGAQNPGSGALTNVLTQFASGAHVNDPNPAVVAAGRDINDLTLSVPKATDIVAGRDIVNLTFAGQNLNSTDLTLISAGRDLIDPVSIGNTSELISVGGPGRLDVITGRNFDLGLSQGLQTTGNLDNANLPSAAGADLTIMAGLGQSPDYADFLSKVVAPDPGNEAQLVSYVEGLTGSSNLSFAQAEQLFAGMSTAEQRVLLNQIFFEELALSGVQDNTVPGAGFTLGYTAIDALFPNSRTAAATGPSLYAGDVSLSFSKIYTDSGGSISIFAPGGSLNVGLATVPAALQGAVNRGPSQLGIVAEGAGDLSIYTKGDVNVNASRIFTLGGGNILIWSDEGNIDAGKGAKTSVSAPPPQVSVSANGTITETFFGAVAGSGIRTIQALPDVAPGNVNLIAPEGTVNAGDAGIGASGNINIAAQHVLGLDNIQFGGTATGVPAQVSDIGVALSGAASLASSATNTATSSSDEEARKNAAAAPQAQAAVSWLDVFVIGLGEENCAPQDTECLKRAQKK